MEERASYNSQKLDIRPSTLLKYDNGWTQPTPLEVRSLINFLNLSGSKVANLVGIRNNRTVRKWQEVKEIVDSGDHEGETNRNKNDIPYAAWRLLLLEAGLVTSP